MPPKSIAKKTVEVERELHCCRAAFIAGQNLAKTSDHHCSLIVLVAANVAGNRLPTVSERPNIGV